MATILFVFMISLLFIHEMDAVRTKEWGMFIILKDMPDEIAYKVFTLAHIPLYFIAILILVQGGAFAKSMLYYIIDIFLIGHVIIHYGFRNKPSNGFTSIFSKAIIYSLGLLAIIHICLLLLT